MEAAWQAASESEVRETSRIMGALFQEAAQRRSVSLALQK
jgi:hypothetical protein